MSIPNINLITYNPNTSLYQDLSGIFQPISLGSPSSIITGFKVGSQDLNQIFADLSGSSSINFTTGFIVPGYGDLSTIFAAYNPVVPSSIPFTATGSYKTILSDTTYTVTFTGNGTITFNKQISNSNLLVVGGGGVGEKYNSGFKGGGVCGGGGAGGHVTNYTIYQLNINTYTILVGGSNTSSSFGSYSALAGNNAFSNNNNTNNITTYLGTTYLGGVGNGGGGSGGNGEYTKLTMDSATNLIISTTYNATNGTDGTLISWLNNTYYGGGGAGGSILPTSTSISGGAGGGGAGGGNSINANDGNPGTTNTGGGGAGGNNGNYSDGYGNGGQGGSGVVILQFTYP